MHAQVAVPTPGFEEGAFDAQAVDSVREDEPGEVVVASDGSSNASTLEVLHRLHDDGIRVLHPEVNRGPPLRETTGRLGHDDALRVRAGRR